MLSYAKSATARHRLNGFKHGKTQLFNSWGDIKWAYFQKKWSVPLNIQSMQTLFTPNDNNTQFSFISNEIQLYSLFIQRQKIILYIYLNSSVKNTGSAYIWLYNEN